MDIVNSNNSSSSFALTDGLISNILAASLMFIVAAVGVTANVASVVLCLRLKSLQNPFCLLFVSTACADCGVLTAFGVWAAPLLLTGSPVALSRVGKAVSGLWILPCWVASVMSTLSVAINRYIAISSPQRYAEIYSIRNVIINVCISWLVGIVYTIPFSLDGCEMYFDPIGYFAYHYTTQSLCGLILDYICSAICCVIFVFILAINLATFVKIRRAAKIVIPKSQNLEVPQPIAVNLRETKAASRRREKEISFFIQACLNNVIFQIVMVFYHTIFPQNLLTNFLIKTMVWEFGHTTNGFIFLGMNKEARINVLRTLCCCFSNFKKKYVGSTAPPEEFTTAQTYQRYNNVDKAMKRIQNKTLALIKLKKLSAGKSPSVKLP